MKTVMKNLTLETYQCPVCGTLYPVYRKKASKRKTDHKKLLYCFKCEKRINFIMVQGKMGMH